ncbi:MAG: phytanoyl-CoA dioxygenase [Proteobacteria bacterium]|nr:MAG: phytanoyl-CoA dioxygenase [Pseudomonadota bacterium]
MNHASPARPLNSSVASLREDFHRDGFVLLKGFFPRERLLPWAEAFRPLLAHHLENYADPSLRGPARYYVTLPFRAPFNDPLIFNDDRLVSLLEEIAGPDFTMCQLATDTPLLGSAFQEIHADAPPLFGEAMADTPAFQLAINFPLCDVSAANGPLEICRRWLYRPEVSIQIPEQEFAKLPARAQHMLRFNPITKHIAEGPETYKTFAY